jgi:cytochrome c oxidase cbb3-type subunit 3
VLTNLDGRSLPAAKADPAKGKEIFATNCVACHGQGGHPGHGRAEPDPPPAFIYGSSFAQLQQTIRYGRQGQMPAQQDIQGNDKVHCWRRMCTACRRIKCRKP